MALKTYSRVLLTLLWLSLFLLFFHEQHTSDSSKINGSSTPAASSPSRHRPIARKVLASKFDFTPFINRLRRHRHRRHQENSPDTHGQPGPAGNEIDPRYGVEKRLVPTGPNPLHH
ncbi:hypothetical protein RHGRI_026976 [Rhododendron griersonianum]|uniref:CLAVATA3/ESR (CLE)-related protein 13 n=1 Tax=Rhododendron griersonianum TaxID=479676 RepID=A0AAV6J0F8_9ERIC|nr:hypothetical protein RHGRI_026976 [Rhododendron griersonianum]